MCIETNKVIGSKLIEVKITIDIRKLNLDII